MGVLQGHQHVVVPAQVGVRVLDRRPEGRERPGLVVVTGGAAMGRCFRQQTRQLLEAVHYVIQRDPYLTLNLLLSVSTALLCLSMPVRLRPSGNNRTVGLVLTVALILNHRWRSSVA